SVRPERWSARASPCAAAHCSSHHPIPTPSRSLLLLARDRIGHDAGPVRRLELRGPLLLAQVEGEGVALDLVDPQQGRLAVARVGAGGGDVVDARRALAGVYPVPP